MINRKKNTCRFLAFLLISILLTVLLSEGMKTTNTIAVINISGFEKEEENTLDVVLIGSSEVYTGYAPTLAWEEYGYTSYNLASPGIAGNLYLPLLKEALRRQNPKVVVFEVNGFLYDEKYYKREGQFRNVVDTLPWSSNKEEIIQTMVEEEVQLSYYFPLLAYHTSWSTPLSFLAPDLYKIASLFSGETKLKGFSTFSNTYQFQGDESNRVSKELTEISKEYLDQLLQYCKDRGMENVLFYRAPHGYQAASEELLQAIQKEVEDYGYDFLNCTGDLSVEIGIDPETDYYNADHLNLRGARKFTSYLGAFLESHYAPGKDRSDQVAERWNRNAEKCDILMEAIDSDMDQGIIRSYQEGSFFIKMPVIRNPEEVLGI